MNAVINLKKRKVIFKKKSLRVVVPLDLAEGAWYTELVCDDDSDDDLNCIYKITVQGEDWVNSTINGRISWERGSSCTLDSDNEITRWQNLLHEVTTLNWNIMIRSLCCIKTEARELSTYDGLSMVDEFLSKFESPIPEQQWFDALKWELRAAPARWWGTHQGNFED